MNIRQKVIKRLKKQLKFHYVKSQANRDMSCGGALGDHIRGNDTRGHYDKAIKLMARLKRVDPEYLQTV